MNGLRCIVVLLALLLIPVCAYAAPAFSFVYNGLSPTTNINYQISTEALSATWEATDANNNITGYQYMITQDSTAGTIIANWTSTGTINYMTHSGLTLTDLKTYFIQVRATNDAPS